MPTCRRPRARSRPAGRSSSTPRYFGEPVRLGSYARACWTAPLAGQGAPQRVVIQVAETLQAREQFTRALVLQALARDLVLVARGRRCCWWRPSAGRCARWSACATRCDRARRRT